MDVDEVEVEIEVTPAPDEQLHLTLASQFNPFPFTHDARNAIFARRSLMSDELVFDLLLEQASIASPQSLFPPDSHETLLDLLTAIAKCPWDSLKKSCLLFYLLSFVSSDVATEHAKRWALPVHFVHLAHACFLLDLGTSDDLAHAVSLLSDARIVQDLSSKILHTLSLAPQPRSSRLVRTYVRTAQPVLETYEDLAIYLRALLEYSLADAWAFQRTFSETSPLRNQLFRTILDGCFIPPKPSVLPHLLSLPLTTFEFSLLHSYALSPPEELTPAAHSILQDLITVRLLHSGKYSDAIKLSRAFDTLNTKSRAGNTASLHKAAADRQQMMRDVLAVVPEVQRRQLELEFSDEQIDGDLTALGASWESMGSDINMSWENLGASEGAKANERARSGRLEGSPAPKPSAKSAPPNTPFGLFSSPANSAHKRKTSAHLSTNIFGTPTYVGTNPPSLPTIPTPGLDASMAAGTSAISPAFRPPQRPTFGNTPTRQPHPILNGIGQASVPRSGTGRDAHNMFFIPEPQRPGIGLFGGQAQGERSNHFSTPRTRHTSGEGNDAGEKQPGQDRMLEDGGGQVPVEDVMMVDSDDPDSFVLRGRRRTLYRPPGQTDTIHANLDPGTEPNTNSMNGTHVNGTTFFGRHQDTIPNDPVHTRPKSSSSSTKILPGGFASFELNEGAPAPPRPGAPHPATHAQQPPSPSPPPPRSTRARTRRTGTKSDPQKIPGALFHDDDADDEAGEDQDNVPSLLSVPSKAAAATAGRHTTRPGRASSTMESGDEENPPKRSLRRSSRISSSAGLSPEQQPSSPPRPERRAGSKRSGRAPAVAGDGTGRRKRKNADE